MKTTIRITILLLLGAVCVIRADNFSGGINEFLDAVPSETENQIRLYRELKTLTDFDRENLEFGAKKIAEINLGAKDLASSFKSEIRLMISIMTVVAILCSIPIPSRKAKQN